MGFVEWLQHNSRFEVHTPSMKQSSFLTQKNKISTVSTKGQVEVKGQTGTKNISPVSGHSTWWCLKMVQEVGNRTTLFFRHLGIRLLGLDSILKICQSLSIKGRTQTWLKQTPYLVKQGQLVAILINIVIPKSMGVLLGEKIQIQGFLYL